MTECEALEDIVCKVGVLTYGKERWFRQNGCWYDRMNCDYIQNEMLVERVCTELEEEYADCKTESQTDIHCSNCEYHDKYGCEPPCDTCEGMSNHKPKNMPHMEVIACPIIDDDAWIYKDESQTKDEILREQCRAFMGIVEQTEGSE